MPIDPVCGVQVNEDEAVATTYEGQTYYFCCDDCRQEFREAPEEYVSEGVEVLTEEEE
jgi:YHS domain-containing protein